METLDLAIVGAGPIGLEAAIRGLQLDWDITVLEKERVGNHLMQWHGVRMFTPNSMNWSETTHTWASEHGLDVPAGDRYPTGKEYVSRWLQPLAYETPLNSVLHENEEVVSISRQGRLKVDDPGGEERARVPFRLVVDRGHEQDIVLADRVIDASGTFDQANPLGTGGVEAPGELEARDRIEYRFPTEDRLEAWSGKRILFVGDGYSAATNLLRFQSHLNGSGPGRIHWLIRDDRERPISPVDNDPLPRRARLTRRANEFAETGEVQLIRGEEIERIESAPEELRVRTTEHRTLPVDRICANVGFRPDRSLYRELQVHECYATEGPIDLSASLMAQEGADCLEVDAGGVDLLENPEPNFYIVGSKAFGRNSNFLLETGFDQLARLFESFRSEPELSSV